MKNTKFLFLLALPLLLSGCTFDISGNNGASSNNISNNSPISESKTSTSKSNGTTSTSKGGTTSQQVNKVNSVTISYKKTSMKVGEQLQLSAKVDVTGSASTGINWTSTDASIASVSTNGLLKALKAGTAIISATSKADSTKKDSFELTVTEDVTKEPFGDVLQCNASYDYYIYGKQSVEYKFCCEAQNGYTLQLKEGSMYATITYEDGSVDSYLNKKLLTSSGLGTKEYEIQFPSKTWIKFNFENTYTATSSKAKFIIYADHFIDNNYDSKSTSISGAFDGMNKLTIDTSITVNAGETKVYQFPLQAKYAYQFRKNASSACSSYITFEDKDGKILNGVDKLLVNTNNNYLTLTSNEAKWVKITVANTYSSSSAFKFIVESAYVRE